MMQGSVRKSAIYLHQLSPEALPERLIDDPVTHSNSSYQAQLEQAFDLIQFSTCQGCKYLQWPQWLDKKDPGYFSILVP